MLEWEVYIVFSLDYSGNPLTDSAGKITGSVFTIISKLKTTAQKDQETIYKNKIPIEFNIQIKPKISREKTVVYSNRIHDLTFRVNKWNRRN